MLLGLTTSPVTRAQSYKLGDGLTVDSQDGKFSMNMRARIVNYLEVNPDGGDTTMGIKRVRLNFSGHLLSEKLTYSLQMGFAPKDNVTLPNGNSNIVRDAILYYKPDSHWTFGVGQARIKANRSHMNSSQNLVFVDRSIVDSHFELDRDYGLFVEYTGNLAPGFPVALKASVTSGEGRNYFKSHDSGLAYTGRIEFYPLGAFSGSGAFSEGDLEHESKPRLMIAGAYSYNDRAMRLNGQTGALIGSGSKSMGTFYADLVFKYQGWSLVMDLMGRTASAPLLDDGSQFIYKGLGYNFQASYNIHKHWEIALRNATLNPSSEVRAMAGYKSWNQTTLALSRYILQHRIKIQADASYNTRQKPTQDYSHWQLRLGMEIGI